VAEAAPTVLPVARRSFCFVARPAKETRMNPRHAAALALVFLASACTTTSTVMKSWVGDSESKLLASWGAPDRTATLPDGGRVDTWVSTWSNNYGLQTCRKTFTVNSEGIVTQWSYSDCGGGSLLAELFSK